MEWQSVCVTMTIYVYRCNPGPYRLFQSSLPVSLSLPTGAQIVNPGLPTQITPCNIWDDICYYLANKTPLQTLPLPGSAVSHTAAALIFLCHVFSSSCHSSPLAYQIDHSCTQLNIRYFNTAIQIILGCFKKVLWVNLPHKHDDEDDHKWKVLQK